MRIFLSIFLLFYSLTSLAQIDNNQNSKLENQISIAFQDSLLRGRSISGGFVKDSLDQFKISGRDFENLAYKTKLENVLISHFTGLSNRNYLVYIYWDVFSNRVFSTVKINASKVETGIFPNYSLIVAEPMRGLLHYFQTMKRDIDEQLSIDTLKNNWFKNQWSNNIDILIDKNGEATYFPTNDLLQYLPSVKLLKWSPALYYVKPRRSFVRLRFRLNDLLNDRFDWSSVDFEVFALDSLFHDKLVLYKENKEKIPFGDIVVSFVLNASTDRFEHPIIHRGDIPLGKELIKFIQAYDYKDIAFYWSDFPTSSRYYFYIR